MNRVEREKVTVTAMIRLYCTHQHARTAPDRGLCQDCERMRSYAEQRLARCTFGEAKPACVKCPVHCYRPDMKEMIRGIMRWSGPRMLIHHPWLALLHLAETLKPAPHSSPILRE